MATYRNGKPLLDTDGNPVHCHGAGLLLHDGWYYLFGEDRRGDNRVSCYRSRDLVNWEFRSIVLSLGSKTARHYIRTDLHLSGRGLRHDGLPEVGPRGANIERPKVLYCEKTGKFVMWMHFENGRDYNAARCAVAVCDSVDGDYTYLGSFNPVGNMSRDCTLFKDDDGTAYFISSSRDNADMIIYRLSEDYLSIDEQVKTLWPGQYREAPVLFKRGGYYFMLTSECTGWNPNQGGYAVASSIEGRWSSIRPFGGPTTFNTQPTAAIEVGGTMLYIGDRWDPSDYFNSGIIILPLSFPKEGVCEAEWADEVDISPKGVSARTEEKSLVRIMLHDKTNYVASDGYNVFAGRLGYANKGLLWKREDADGGFVLRHAESGRCLSGDGIMAEYSADEPRLVWRADAFEESGLLINRHSGKSFMVFGRRVVLADPDERFGGYRLVTDY